MIIRINSSSHRNFGAMAEDVHTHTHTHTTNKPANNPRCTGEVADLYSGDAGVDNDPTVVICQLLLATDEGSNPSLQQSRPRHSITATSRWLLWNSAFYDWLTKHVHRQGTRKVEARFVCPSLEWDKCSEQLIGSMLSSWVRLGIQHAVYNRGWLVCAVCSRMLTGLCVFGADESTTFCV